MGEALASVPDARSQPLERLVATGDELERPVGHSDEEVLQDVLVLARPLRTERLAGFLQEPGRRGCDCDRADGAAVALDGLDEEIREFFVERLKVMCRVASGGFVLHECDSLER